MRVRRNSKEGDNRTQDMCVRKGKQEIIGDRTEVRRGGRNGKREGVGGRREGQHQICLKKWRKIS